MTDISIHLTESEYNLVRQHIENKGSMSIFGDSN